MLVSCDLQTINLLVSLSKRTVEETCLKCEEQLPRLYNQRRALVAKRKKLLARKAKQNEELRELYRSLGLVQPVE